MASATGARASATTVRQARAACARALLAFERGALADREHRAQLLHACADALTASGERLVETAIAESGLGETRLRGELKRTTSQLLSFAALVREGSHLDCAIDRTAGADVRRMAMPIGPVAVFGASNFPLAFGVAGGDTASALAAGCSVVVKGHPSQPATNELVAQALAQALEGVRADPAIVATVAGKAFELGHALVDAPETAAVAFTGSLAGGRALLERAVARERPIPVFAEMGSVNPLIVTPAAAASRAEEIARGLAASIAGSAGQLCTKPGLLLAPEDDGGAHLLEQLCAVLAEVPAQPMLDARLRDSLQVGIDELAGDPDVEVLLTASERGLAVRPFVARLAARAALLRPSLLEERFGPAALVVQYDGERQLLELLRSLPGQLTGTLHAEPHERELSRGLLAALAERSGRVVFGGYPTGVAVVAAMQHGGPYPASTAPAHTSVGSAAIRRFLRPVCFQDVPQELLPAELRDGNPCGLWRLLDGSLKR